MEHEVQNKLGGPGVTFDGVPVPNGGRRGAQLLHSLKTKHHPTPCDPWVLLFWTSRAVSANTALGINGSSHEAQHEDPSVAAEETRCMGLKTVEIQPAQPVEASSINPVPPCLLVLNQTD